MDIRTNHELLREYTRGRAQAVFSELVRRFINFLYSAAFRLVGNSLLAEDASQKVFLALAQNTDRFTCFRMSGVRSIYNAQPFGKLIFMTTLQKTIIASALIAGLGTGIYQYAQNWGFRDGTQTVVQQQTFRGQSELPRTKPDTVASLGAALPSRSPVATSPRQVARPKNAKAPGGFQSTELYAFITNTAFRLSDAQVGPYLNANGRNSSSLLAAFRTTGEPALLAEALKKYPNDPQVGFEAASRNDASPKERREGLEAFKQGAPDNALANYLSALDYFKTGHKDEAVQELNAAATKRQLSDYTAERSRSDEELYLAAGYPAGHAQMMGDWFLPEAQLTQVRELGQNIVDLAASYRQAGDPNSSDVALQMALDLGRRFDDPSSGQSMRWQLIGIRVERAALQAIDAVSPIPGNDQAVQDRLNQLAGQMQSIQALTKQADPIWKTLSDNDWTDYHGQIAAVGEEAAVRWLVSNYGQH
jgi:hypothetical protein